MSPAFRHFLLVLGILAGVAASLRFVAAPAFVSYLSYQAPCSQPCPDARGCQPVALTLELARPEAKLGRRYPLWYKVKLVNQSCFSLYVSGSGYFTGGDPDLTILDSNGVEVKREYPKDNDSPFQAGKPFKMPAYGAVRGRVFPYQRDMTELERLWDRNLVSDHGSIDLKPGESMETQPFVLDPYRYADVEMRWPDGSRGSGTQQVPVPAPAWAETPPPGFAPLDDFVFHRPGRHRMVATYRSKHNVGPEYPRLQALPKTILKIMNWLDQYLDLDFFPKNDSRDIQVEAVSNAVDFEARP